jgi:aminoglycoside phosphotransferase (APT) family kinase protein
MDAEPRGELPLATRAWLERVLGPSVVIGSVERLRGGWSSEMRSIEVRSADDVRRLVLRSFTRARFAAHAEAMLIREADILQLLAATTIPVAEVIAVDPRAEVCAAPSLLRTWLPGAIQLQDDASVSRRSELLARLLVQIHGVRVAETARPRTYQAWTRHDLVRVPEYTARAELWAKAIDVIRAAPPAYEGCFLHRDFHPGNVLFESSEVSGVVDWVETSWGPADLDVAHCSTSLALLHGVECGLQFAERYEAAGGTLAAAPQARLYWYLLDALAFAPDAEKVAVAWRDMGRSDLTSPCVRARLEDYIAALIERFG